VHVASGHSQQFIAETINNHTTTAGPVDLNGVHPSLARGIVKDLPPYEAVRALNGIDPKKAAEIIGGMPPARVVAFAGHMDAERLTPIVAHLRTELAAMLRLALRADTAMVARETAWHKLIGATESEIVEAGPSQRGTTGFRRDHDHGAMYWSPRTGPGMVAADIVDYYTSCGGVLGRLGFPIRSQKRAGKSPSGTHGSFQRFESTWDYPADMSSGLGATCGATVYQSSHGTFSTFGGIGEYYERHGGTWGALGFPVSEEIEISAAQTASGTPGFRQRFERGTVFWSERTGAAHVSGDIAARVEADFRDLGFPIGEAEEETSEFGTTAATQQFQGSGGTPWTVCSSVHGTWLVDPGLADYHSRHRAEFGFPRADANRYPEPAGTILRDPHSAGSGHGARDRFQPLAARRGGQCVQWFEGGAIFARKGGRPVALGGPTWNLLNKAGNAVRLGHPTSPARPIGDGPDTVQFFTRGVVTVVDGIASAWYGRPDAGTEG
jgi:hypothetical protein